VKVSYISLWLPIVHYGNIYILIFLDYFFNLNSITLSMIVTESKTNWKPQETECSQGNWP